MDLPTSKMERWKYTNLATKLKKLNLVEGVSESAKDAPDWARKILARSAPAGERYGDMMLWEAANDISSNDIIIDVSCGGAEEKQITHIGRDGVQETAREIIRLQEGAALTLIENQNGAGAYWNNIITQIDLAKGAKLKHYRLQEISNESVVTQNTHIVMEEGAEYEAFTLVNGASLSRNQIHVDMNGEGGACHLNGVNLIDGARLSDTTITIEHHAPNCKSSQNYRTVAKDKSVGVFQGKIHVHKAAQKTDGYQMAKSLLLSQQATINTKPELEIYADDVKCAHGATTGQLDEDALFYMQSRGIAESEARKLLVQAFLSEIVEGIENENIQQQANEIVEAWLS